MALDPIIVRTWACLPQIEREAFYALGSARLMGRPFEFAAAVRLFFQVGAPTYWQKRFNAWLGNSTYRVTTIKIDGVDVEIITTVPNVALQTAAGIAAGKCPLTVTPCLQVTGF